MQPSCHHAWPQDTCSTVSEFLSAAGSGGYSPPDCCALALTGLSKPSHYFMELYFGTVLRGRYRHLHLSEEATEAQRGKSKWPKVMQPVIAELGFPIQEGGPDPGPS